MKNLYLLFLLITTVGFSQIPTNYYSTATGSGYALKTQLKKIIDNVNDGLATEYLHIDKGYGSGTSQTNNGLWSGYGTTDRDNGIGYENDNTIVDIYSENPAGVDPYNFNFNTTSGANAGQCGTYSVEGDCYNREHLIPQSYFGSTGIARNDIQHVYPTDGKVNGMRNDWPFGKVGTATFISNNGSKLGTATNSGYAAGYSGTAFEPIDEFKGDIARVFFYFATRYEDQMTTFYNTYTTVDARVMFDGSSDKVFSTTFLNILLTWHQQDPVSTKEILRNNAAFNHQSNRNPFIDHPEYVCQIWNTACASLSDTSFSLDENSFKVFPNPSNGNFNITFPESNGDFSIEVLSVIGQKIYEKNNINTDKLKVDNLEKGVYLLKISKDSQKIVKKIVIN